MKFGKTYTEYIERETINRLSGCSYVEFKRLKKVLKRCPLHDLLCSSSVATSSCALVSSQPSDCSALRAFECRSAERDVPLALATTQYPSSCPGNDFQACPACQSQCIFLKCCIGGLSVSTPTVGVDEVTGDVSQLVSTNEACVGCDGKFFGELMEELAEVVGCFNTRAQQLLELHLASGFRKYLLRLKSSRPHDREAMIQEGQVLLSYAFLNATAVRKILKKYDKVHQSKGGVLRERLLAMRGELLQSPWLIELSALHINLADAEASSPPVTEGIGDFSCDCDGDRPTLSCTLLESARLDFNLTCCICLETVFDPVSLKCGHLFCNSCVCEAASVTAFEGPGSARGSAKCPLCRKAGVYLNAVQLKELALLVRNRCPEYWEERRQKERKEQLEQARRHYNEQLQAVMGI